MDDSRDSGQAMCLRSRFSRRELLPLSLKLGGLAVAASKMSSLWGSGGQALAQTAGPLVIGVRHNRATWWDYNSNYYWDFVDQAVVNQMVDYGITALAKESSPAAAWQRVMAAYRSGDKVAVKINCNGNEGPTVANHVIDACIEPIVAVIRGLVGLGIPQQNIFVYDGVRVLHSRYATRIHAWYPAVQVVDGSTVTYGLTGDLDERIVFRNPDMEALYIADVLIRCQHLINIPILKSHCCGVTGALKNHVGSQSTHSNSPWCRPDPIHNHFDESVTDLNLNRHIRDKTRLVVADGLFGNWSHCVVDNGVMVGHPWRTFGNGAPNFMFFSFDPVALDSVMFDFLKAETDARGIRLNDAEHLHYAEASGLGTHDHRPYSRIVYKEFDISEGPECFVATAVYGSGSCEEVVVLRRFRDEVLARSCLGRKFIELYYRIGPRMADFVERKVRLKAALRKALNVSVTLFGWVLSRKACLERGKRS